MKPYLEIVQNIQTWHEMGETIQAAYFVLREYGLEHPKLRAIELREKAKPDFVLMTTEGNFGESQIIKIPENTFEFEFILMLNLLAHEMVHVMQKSSENCPRDRNEREWQAYYEMLFHNIFPLVPNAKPHQLKFFGNKALEYYHRMEKDGELQQKYAAQKAEVEQYISKIS